MNIYDQTLKMLENYFKSYGENPAKAKIVFRAVYKEKVSSFSQINNLSTTVKERLISDFELTNIEFLTKSEDENACKYLFRLSDGHTIETVLMKHDYGNGVCVSTQVGCNMNCAFCESGKLKKIRNLKTHEIVQQVLYISDILKLPISHIVLMGIGEPFDNYDNVMDFIDIITEQLGTGIAARHVTISTCGITPKIIEYSKRDCLNSLAISLHAPNNELRNIIMPINKKYSIQELISASKTYTEKSNKKITFAYIMIKDLNDSNDCALQLAELVKDINCYINLIPYNKTQSANYEPSEKKRISEFFDILKKHGINVTVRREFGSDMNAACGQLRANYSKIN